MRPTKTGRYKLIPPYFLNSCFPIGLSMPFPVSQWSHSPAFYATVQTELVGSVQQQTKVSLKIVHSSWHKALNRTAEPWTCWSRDFLLSVQCCRPSRSPRTFRCRSASEGVQSEAPLFSCVPSPWLCTGPAECSQPCSTVVVWSSHRIEWIAHPTPRKFHRELNGEHSPRTFPATHHQLDDITSAPPPTMPAPLNWDYQTMSLRRFCRWCRPQGLNLSLALQKPWALQWGSSATYQKAEWSDLKRSWQSKATVG